MTPDVGSSERALSQLLASYPVLVDADELEALMEHFTEDCEFVAAGTTYTGRDEVTKFLRGAAERGAKGIHVPSPPWIDIAPDGVNATSSQNYLFVADGSNLVKRGSYRDLVVYDGGRWRIKRRTVDIHQPPDAE